LVEDASLEEFKRLFRRRRGMSANGREETGGREPGRTDEPWWNFGGNFAWAASLFLAGLGAKFGLILAKGFSLPYHDQWPGEAYDMFMPYLSGKFSSAVLFEPHNEHWIIFTRIVNLALLRLNGQWDGLLEMACNAVIHCAGVAGFGWVMASLLGKRSWLLLWPALALDLALPFAWENTLWGFQSQFYFLLIFSWLTIWLLGLHQPWSARWWLGTLTALAALFTVASGFLAAVAVLALTALTAFTQRNWRRHLPTWAFCAAMIGLGLALKFSLGVDHVDEAHSAADLLRALGKSLAWPWVILPWYAPFNLFPLLLLGWTCLRSPEPPKPGERMIFGVGIWAGLQALAGAYARGNGGVGPAWRYMDSLSFISISGALAAFVLLNDHRPRFPFVPLLYVALACWTLSVLAGLGFLTTRAWSQALPEMSAEQAVQLKAARAWLATGDPRVFLAQPADQRLAPLADWLMNEPHIRGILPACVREPLHLFPAQNSGNAFVRNGWLLATADEPTEKSWGSYSAQQAAARGTFVSQPVPRSTLPYQEIPVAGDLGGEGLSLELVEINGGRVTEVRPAAPPGGAWVNVRIKAPAGEFKVVARDDSDTKWFAFKEPRELGAWSFWTLRLLEAWKYFVVLGLGGFLLNLASTRGGRRNSLGPKG
jgi:hypothetical protein